MHDKRQNDQLELAFEVSGEGEAQAEGVEGTESSTAEDGLTLVSRIAVYGPVRTVVWEGRSREAPPYPDRVYPTNS